MLSQSVKPQPRRRQPRRAPRPEYKAGDALRITATYQGGTRTVAARVKRISVKPSAIRDIPIVTYVLETWEGGHRSIVMSEAEFNQRVR